LRREGGALRGVQDRLRLGEAALVELRGERRPVQRGDAVGDGRGGGLCGHQAPSRGSGVFLKTRRRDAT